MKNVLLANPRVETRATPPLGLCYIAAILEKDGHNVKIYDPIPTRKGLSKSFEYFLKEFNPDIVAFTCTSPQEDPVFAQAKLAKQFNPKILTVVGGSLITSDGERIIKNEYMDVAVQGEGEITFGELVNAIEQGKGFSGIKGVIYKEGNNVIKNQPRELIEDLDSLPFPARHLLDMKWYARRNSMVRGEWLKTTSLMGARGCPHRCIFCASPKTLGRKVRLRSPENYVNEIEELVSKYGIEAIRSVEDVFTHNPRWVNEFCDKLIERKLSIKWDCQSRVNAAAINLETLRKMKKAGCVQICFGVESGSQRILDIIKKDVKVEETIKAFDLCHKAEIRAMANFIIGHPYETLEDIEKTRQLARRIKADYTQFYIATPLPGTELYEMAEKNKWLRDGKTFYGREAGEHLTMECEFTAKELLRIRNELDSEFSKSTIKSYLTNFNFMRDLVTTNFRHPEDAVGHFKVLVRTKSVTELARSMEVKLRLN